MSSLALTKVHTHTTVSPIALTSFDVMQGQAFQIYAGFNRKFTDAVQPAIPHYSTIETGCEQTRATYDCHPAPTSFRVLRMNPI